MSKALIFHFIGMVSGAVGILTNGGNPQNIILFGIIMICSYMVFQGTLAPMTNILSYFMANKTNKVFAVRQYEAKQDALSEDSE